MTPFDVTCSRAFSAPTNLAPRVHNPVNPGSNGKNNFLVADDGLRKDSMDAITRLRTVRRNWSAQADPKRLPGGNAIAAKPHRRTKDYCQGSQSSANIQEDSHREMLVGNSRRLIRINVLRLAFSVLLSLTRHLAGHAALARERACLKGFRAGRAAGELKGLRHWLCSNRRLLRGSQRRGTCTVTAPDATTAFAVPNPSSLSRRLSVFSGLVARRVTRSGWLPSLLRTGD